MIDHVEHRTFRCSFTRALLDGLGQEPFEPGQVSDFRARTVEVVRRDLLHLTAGRLAGLTQFEERPNLVRCEAELTPTSDEGQRLNMLSAIGPMPPSVRGGAENRPIFSK